MQLWEYFLPNTAVDENSSHLFRSTTNQAIPFLSPKLHHSIKTSPLKEIIIAWNLGGIIRSPNLNIGSKVILYRDHHNPRWGICTRGIPYPVIYSVDIKHHKIYSITISFVRGNAVQELLGKIEGGNPGSSTVMDWVGDLLCAHRFIRRPARSFCRRPPRSNASGRWACP